MTMTVDFELPKVQGSHRNRTLAKARRNRCVQLATERISFEAIAKEMGYARRSTPWRHALGAQQAKDVTHLRERTYERLEGQRRLG